MKPMRLAVAMSLLAFGSARAANTVKIGLMAPLTGSWASEGQEMKRNVELLAAEQNARGGLLGKQIEVVIEDDGGDPRTAALAAQRLTTKGVVAVIGTYGSAVTEATQAILDEAGLIQVANGSTAVRLTEKGLKYFFRTCPRDDEQGRVGAAILEKTKAKKVALLHDNSAYSKGLADEIATILKSRKNANRLLRRPDAEGAGLLGDPHEAQGGGAGRGLLHGLLPGGRAAPEAEEADGLEGAVHRR